MMEANSENNKRKGGNVHCVAGTSNKKSCTNTSKNAHIRFHLFPSHPETRRRWTQFVQRHRPRPGFNPDNFSRPHLCSAHFEPSCHSKRFSGTLEGFDSSKTKCFFIERIHSNHRCGGFIGAGTNKLRKKKWGEIGE